MADRTGDAKLALVMLGFGMALFGSATPVSKIVGESLPVLVGAFLRVLIGAVVLLPVTVKMLHVLSDLSISEWLRLGFIALFGMFGFTLFMLFGMRLVPGVVGSIVMSTTPAVTAAASIAFMGDRLDWRKAMAIALAVVGVVVVNYPGESVGVTISASVLWGSALVFLAVCCEAAYTLLGKRATEKRSPVLVTFLAATLSVPLLLPLAAVEAPEVNWTEIEWQSWVAIAWWGAGTLGLGSLLWYAGVARVSGTTAASFMGVMPVSALVLSYILLGETVRWIHLAGFAIVFAGVLLVISAHRRGSGADS